MNQGVLIGKEAPKFPCHEVQIKYQEDPKGQVAQVYLKDMEVQELQELPGVQRFPELQGFLEVQELLEVQVVQAVLEVMAVMELPEQQGIQEVQGVMEFPELQEVRVGMETHMAPVHSTLIHISPTLGQPLLTVHHHLGVVLTVSPKDAQFHPIIRNILNPGPGVYQLPHVPQRKVPNILQVAPGN